MATREKTIEIYLVEQIEAAGGECLKTRGARGMPDRHVYIGGEIYPVELKAPGKTPEPHQVRLHEKLKRTGNPVEVISTLEQVDNFVVRVTVGSVCYCADCVELRGMM